MDMDEIMNMVPRSRLTAMEAEIKAAEDKTAQVQMDAGKEIHRLLARVTELKHALKVCHADATNGISANAKGMDVRLQDYLLSIQLTAGNAINGN